MSRRSAADESRWYPRTRLMGRRSGWRDITLHLHRHGDTRMPHPVRLGDTPAAERFLRNVEL
ncbi:uncharacterized protein V6R79_023180 [Siganus canaliculatus]